jgi:aminoglycoside 2''-phosphotransferase
MDASPVYLDRIRESRPDLTLHQLRTNRDGLVNDVVIINDEWVFRFPKNDEAAQALPHEVNVVKLLRGRVRMSLPQYQLHAGPFVSYGFLPGAALHREDILLLDDMTQDRLAEQLGTFLYDMHNIPLELVREHGVGTSSAARTREDWLRFYGALERELFPLLMTHSREWGERHFAPVLDERLSLEADPMLIHGDLGPYHILYDPDARRINGILDFGTAGLGDPADDFANVIYGLGESFLRRKMRFHPDIAPALDRARFHAGTLELQWVLLGLRTDDRSWFVSHIGRARDMWPIGAH